jgi:hypothetical protein
MMDGMGTEGSQRVIGQKFSSGGAILSGHVSRPQAPRNRNENRAGGSIATTCRRAGLLKITSDKRLYRKQWHVSASRKALIGHPARRGNLSNMAMASVLHRMDRKEITVHGFRSKFRDWAAERTNYQNHVVEMALAHVIGDKVEAAYRRGELFAKRVRLMTDWARYCMSKPTEVSANIFAVRRR